MTRRRPRRSSPHSRTKSQAALASLPALRTALLTAVAVTGPSVGGIGFETARSIAAKGANVILAGRSMSK